MAEAVQLESPYPKRPRHSRTQAQESSGYSRWMHSAGLVMVLDAERTHASARSGALLSAQRDLGSSSPTTPTTSNGKGCSLHDLIQPAFSFLVGAALPFSIASRKTKGQTFGQMLGPCGLARVHSDLPGHLSAVAVVAIRPTSPSRTRSPRSDLGYVFLFLLGFTRVRTQVIAFLLILICFLGGIRALSRAGSALRLRARRCSAELGSQLHRISLALEQEFQSVVGIRCLVPESVSARASFRLQRRRMVYPEFHSNARDHDPRTPDGRMAQSAEAPKNEKLRGLVDCGSGLVVAWARRVSGPGSVPS